MGLPGVQEDGIQRRVHGPDHVVHPARRGTASGVKSARVAPGAGRAAFSYLGLMRLATVMMSLRLAGALTFAPEPIVMATSFSVRVWQICARKCRKKKKGSRVILNLPGSNKIQRNPGKFRLKQHIL